MSATTHETTWRRRPAGASEAIDDDTARLIDGWWRAANYLSVGQIYLLDNPMLRRPLKSASPAQTRTFVQLLEAAGL